MGFIQALSLRFDDPRLDQWRRNVEERLVELQRAPAVGLAVIAGVELEDGIETKVLHRLGRRPALAFPSFVRGAVSTGRIVESVSPDPAKYLVLTASGWGATITIDIGVL